MAPCCGGANQPLASLAPTFDKRQGMLETFRGRCFAKRTKKAFGVHASYLAPCVASNCPGG